MELSQQDPTHALRTYTQARIGLGNVGGALPTAEVLALKHAHAMAKDAVFTELDTTALMHRFAGFDLPVFSLKSKVANKLEYLKRPDFGRLLDEESVQTLKEANLPVDIMLVICDGLSAVAVEEQAFLVLEQIIPFLQSKYSLAIALVKYGRVAIADHVGELLGAKMTVNLIGERPGLSSPHSMGMYTCYLPKVGNTDERRNCISNIHDQGLSALTASKILSYYIESSFAKQYSGVDLKLDLNFLNP